MVLKYGPEPDEIFFVEATSTQGVTVKRWSDIVTPNLGTFYSKIAFRHLEYERTEQCLERLE